MEGEIGGHVGGTGFFLTTELVNSKLRFYKADKIKTSNSAINVLIRIFFFNSPVKKEAKQL